MLKARPDCTDKGSLLNLDRVLKNALDMRPGVSIHGGSIPQDFELDRRMDQELIDKCRDVISGKQKSIDLEMDIENCQRTFGSTLSYHLAMKYNEGESL